METKIVYVVTDNDSDDIYVFRKRENAIRFYV
jgi:hypothetical protein